MKNSEANSKARKLFNRWRKGLTAEQREQFTEDCLALHNVIGVYEVLTDKNALKMASICSSIPFVPPFRMLMKLQKTTEN